MEQKQDGTLTQGERDVLLLVGKRLTNQEIADQLDMTTHAVKAFIYQICNKLGARNRIEAVLFAIRQGIMSVDEIYSLDELVELFATMRPERLEMIAGLLRQDFDEGRLLSSSEWIPHVEKTQDNTLTIREREVLALVARGLTNQEIADQLCTSVNTVKTYLYHTCLKLEASNRNRAFVAALRQGAMSVDEVFSPEELVELLRSLRPGAIEAIAQRLKQRPKQEHLLLGSG